MTVEPGAVLGLFVLATELLALTTVGYVFARVVLRQSDARLSLAQGLVVGPALWGLTANFVLHLLPGRAGGLACWVLVLAVGAFLARRNSESLRVRPSTVVRFAIASMAIFWVALACRQLLGVPDELLHSMIPATIQAGTWPPTLAWNPGVNFAYHHGVDLLVALLAPPIGPDLAFTTEILGAYAWTSLLLLVAASLLRQRSSMSTLLLAPLLLAPGAWALVFGDQPTTLQAPVPTGLPSAGLRAALASVYWPTVELPWTAEQQGVPPNISKPTFSFAYALAFVVIERMSSRGDQSWPGEITLAGLIGFLGLLDETIAPVVALLWGAVAVSRPVLARLSPSSTLKGTLRAVAGPVLALALLAIGGGVLTGVLTGISGSRDLSLGWPLNPLERGALVSLTSLDGGLGLLNLGALIVATVAVLTARRSRLVLILGAASSAFLLGALLLRYPLAQHDIARFDGHARNFALLALLLGLSTRLSELRLRWRYAAAVLIFALVTWPTIAKPARKAGLAVAQGVQISNAGPGSREFGEGYWWMGRYPLEQLPSEPIADWVRRHTDVDARILSPAPYALTISTGRPNASGFADFLHTRPYTGSGYLDAIRLLEPAALGRLEIEYVHAPDDWSSNLPNRAKLWLDNPALFEPLILDGAHTLYRVQPAFRELRIPPAPESFEALRQAVPPNTGVYLSPSSGSLNAFRAVAVLPHAHLLGSPNRAALHLQADIPTSPLGSQPADLVVTAAQLAPSMFHPSAQRPVFWNEEIAVYAPAGTIAPLQDPPPRPFTVRVTDAQESDGRLAFTATLSETAGEGWTGQDWLVVPADESPWALPRIRPTDPAAQWYAGQATPQPGSVTHRYEFHPQAVMLTLQDSPSDVVRLDSSGDRLEPGVWILAVRLRSEYQLSAFIPVVKVVISWAGDASLEAYEGEYGVRPVPRPAEP